MIIIMMVIIVAIIIFLNLSRQSLNSVIIYLKPLFFPVIIYPHLLITSFLSSLFSSAFLLDIFLFFFSYLPLARLVYLSRNHSSIIIFYFPSFSSFPPDPSITPTQVFPFSSEPRLYFFLQQFSLLSSLLSLRVVLRAADGGKTDESTYKMLAVT